MLFCSSPVEPAVSSYLFLTKHLAVEVWERGLLPPDRFFSVVAGVVLKSNSLRMFAHRFLFPALEKVNAFFSRLLF